MKLTQTILKNKNRYPNTANELPDEIIIVGTETQARNLAERLTNWYAGCDYLFFVDEKEEY